jgi:hypothetical protein
MAIAISKPQVYFGAPYVADITLDASYPTGGYVIGGVEALVRNPDGRNSRVIPMRPLLRDGAPARVVTGRFSCRAQRIS